MDHVENHCVSLLVHTDNANALLNHDTRVNVTEQAVVRAVKLKTLLNYSAILHSIDEHCQLRNCHVAKNSIQFVLLRTSTTTNS